MLSNLGIESTGAPLPRHPSYLPCLTQGELNRWITQDPFISSWIPWMAAAQPVSELLRPTVQAKASLVRPHFELVWLWLSIAFCAVSSPSCCCYQKMELGIAIAADPRLIMPCWQMVLGNTKLVYVPLCTAPLSATSRFWFRCYQAATETLAWGTM